MPGTGPATAFAGMYRFAAFRWWALGFVFAALDVHRNAHRRHQRLAHRNINLSIDRISTFCLYPNTSGFNLSATVTGGFNNGPLLWSGTGITNAAIGTFDPLVAGAGAHNITLTYMEQACTYKGVTLINIVPKTSPNFNIAAEICQDSITRVSYTGSAEPPSSTYFWIFDGGIPATSNGQGPHDVAWASPGIKNVQLIVNNGICADTIIKPITVISLS